MRTRIAKFGLACGLAAFVITPAFAQTGTSTENRTNAENTTPQLVFSETNHLQGTIQSINRLTRKVVLRRQDGRTVKLAVGGNVRNFSRIRRGDQVDLVFYQSVALAFGKPGETLAPTSTRQMVVRRGPGQRPAGMVMTVSDGSATVESVNREKREVTLKEPDGNTATIRVDPSVASLDQINKGDKVNASRTEALAVSIEAPQRNR